MAAETQLRAVITADDKASATLARVGANMGALGSHTNRLSDSFNGAADAIGSFGKKALVATAVVGVGIVAVTKMAFEQVRSVENASIAFRAYEKDATKVNKVLGDLVTFARSDLGTLFNREDLFAAAQTLKIFGQSTDTITEKVKILARGVSLGKTTFQELSQIIGRAAAKGRLDAVDFDMLIERGIGLDKSFRGATVTSETLFAALEKALPVELLQGRANTIDGAMIRLKSSFRDLGSAILGVDAQTSKFVAGGLGDRLMKTIEQIRQAMKDPELIKAFKELGMSLANFAERAIPKLIEGFQWLIDNRKLIVITIESIVGAFAALKIAGIISNVVQLGALLANPGTWAVAGVLALVAGFVLLYNNSASFRQTINEIGSYLKDTFEPAFQEVATFWNETFIPTMQMVADYFEFVIKPKLQEIADMLDKAGINGELLAQVLGGALILAMVAIAAAIIAVVGAIQILADIFIWVGKIADAWGYNMMTLILNVIGFFQGLGRSIEQFGYNAYGVLASIGQWFYQKFQDIKAWISNALNEITSWFRSLPDSIARGLGGLWGAITKPFSDAFNWIKGEAGKVKDAIAGALDPTKKHSPSLVDKVLLGTGAIKDEYANLFTSIQGYQSDFRVADLAQPISPQATAPMTTSNSNSTINITISSMYSAGSEVEKRKFAKDILGALQDVANQKNTTVSNLMGA